MATEVELHEHYWRCDKYPWGCNKKHETEEEAIACEKDKNVLYAQQGNSAYRSFLGKLIRK